MAVTCFAAIDIGSYDISLEIFEVSRKNGIHCIDKILRRLEIGKGSFSEGVIHMEMVNEIGNVLIDFNKIVKSYHVDDLRVIATSAIREATNSPFVLGRLKQMTGMDIRVLSNAEQRFLNYKAMASVEGRFEEMIKNGTAIIDLDGGSVQVSLFDKSRLITTQNIKIGNLRLRELLQEASAKSSNFDELVSQLISFDIESFRKMYIKDRKIENIILNGDFITEMIFNDPKHRDRSTRVLSRADFDKWYRKITGKSVSELAMQNNIPMEYASLLRPSAILYYSLVEMTGAQMIWTPGTHLSRGLAYEFAENQGLLKVKHNFEDDILSCARQLSKRYAASKTHTENLDMMATAIFDSLESLHGMTSRGRLMLRVGLILHDVGKYISYNYISECSYHIVMANEIIGLSHKEQSLIALALRYTTVHFPTYEELVFENDINMEDYIVIAEMNAIIRLVNALDRSHLQKVKSIKADLKGEKLVLHLDVAQDYALEMGMLKGEIKNFGEVYGILPVIKTRRIV
ncbi:MAG: exopolyphosphatase [Eubacteriales bacterium]|nr:exopolyphosphatase [Eubacteriales bacterium]